MNDPSQRKAPAIVEDDWMFEESELRPQTDDLQFGIPADAAHRNSTPPPPPKCHPRNEEDNTQTILPFSSDELERIKETVQMMKTHGIPI